jgi:hypothetical protein
MASEDDFIVCDLCKTGRLSSSLRELRVRQSSDKGYVHFSATIAVRTCDFCGAKSYGPGADQILDKAFRREYDRLT